MKLIINVENCEDCPMKVDEYSHGGDFVYCSHIDSPSGYGNVLWEHSKGFIKTPSWCPISREEQ